MSQTKKIHGYTVEYDPESESVKNAFKFFDEIGEDATEAFFEEALHDDANHTCHLKVKNRYNGREYRLSLIYKRDGTYHLRKTTGY